MLGLRDYIKNKKSMDLEKQREQDRRIKVNNKHSTSVHEFLAHAKGTGNEKLLKASQILTDYMNGEGHSSDVRKELNSLLDGNLLRRFGLWGEYRAVVNSVFLNRPKAMLEEVLKELKQIE